MKMAPVTELKNRLSHYLRLVARGESVTIVDREGPWHASRASKETTASCTHSSQPGWRVRR